MDVKPGLWENRVSLFGAYLVEKGVQSSTLRSYVSGIKRTLIDDGYDWADKKILLTTLTWACKVINDRVKTRLPIRRNLLEILVFELERLLDEQPYLEMLYKALFLLSYYGLF